MSKSKEVKVKHSSRDEHGMAYEYSVWKSMLRRCSHSSKSLRPTYIGCHVSDDWLSFQVFAEWLKSNKFYGFGYDLDKDILSDGSKIYSPETCVLVPREINAIFKQYSRPPKHELPVGVHYQKRNKHKKYGASIYIGKSEPRIYLGYFKTIQEAHMAYAVEKEGYAKRLANKWRGRIDERVYDALMNWRVTQ